MTDQNRIEHWLYVLSVAEHQLDEARRRSDVGYAAHRLMSAKLELKRLGVDWRAHLSSAKVVPLKRPLSSPPRL